MREHTDYTMDGWPGRAGFMNTGGGMLCFAYRVSETCQRDLDKGLGDLRDERVNPLSGKKEKVYTSCRTSKGEFIHYSSELYMPLLEAKTRVIKCLQGKGAENFTR